MVLLAGISGIILSTCLHPFERDGCTGFKFIIISAIIISVTYASMTIFSIYLQTTGEFLVHLVKQRCPNGIHCKFRKRYAKQRYKHKFGRIMTTKQAQKTAERLFRVSGTMLGSKKSLKSKKLDQKKLKEIKNSRCFICMEKTSGFAFMPCKHTGVCWKCGLLSMMPRNQYHTGKRLRCPICRKTPKKVFFYEEEEERLSGFGGGGYRLRGLGVQELREKLGMTEAEFDKNFEMGTFTGI